MQLFEELGNDIELALSYEAYAQYLERLAAHDRSTSVGAEAEALRVRASGIRGRLRVSEHYELPPLEGEPTDPWGHAPIRDV